MSPAAAERVAALTRDDRVRSLFLPLIGFKTVHNMRTSSSSKRALAACCSWSRWSSPARFLSYAGFRPLARAPRARPRLARMVAGRERVGKWFAPFALGFVTVYPVLVSCSTAGRAEMGRQFRHPILIYVMLGWGLNIVVGLAGLLDLGYVAFYAVGAYSYALLAKAFGLRSGCCCRSPAFSPRSGACCSAFRCCACAATISPSSRWPSARSSAWS